MTMLDSAVLHLDAGLFVDAVKPLVQRYKSIAKNMSCSPKSTVDAVADV